MSMPKITPHNEMMVHRGEAFSNLDQYDKATRFRRKFYIAGEWWAESHHSERKRNKPKPEFHTQWRPINRIIGTINDMELNAVIVPNSLMATDEGAELLQKRWRNDFQNSEGIEANENATAEMVVGGFGCVKVISKYEDEESPDPDEQYLCVEIVPDASSSVRFGVEAIKRDKSDAKRAWQLIKGDRASFEKQFNVDRIVSFPSNSDTEYNTYTFDEKNNCYLAHYYEVVETKVTDYDFRPLADLTITAGDGIKGDDGKSYTRSEIAEMKRIYEEQTGEMPQEKRRVEKCVMYALCDGEKYLTKPQKMPFKRVPLIPRYAYHAIIDGEEYFCGELEKQNDPEMFINYYGSSLMEIMAADQIEKPEYLPEQIQKHMGKRASQHRENYPVLMSEPVMDQNGAIVHMGPVGKYTPPNVGSGLLTAGAFVTERLNANSAMGQATTPANVSGEAIESVNERQDDALLPVVKACLHSIRAACETWIPAAQALYFSTSKSIRVMSIDGNYETINTLEMTFNQNGEFGPYGNNPIGKYSVQVEKGEAYKDQREAARASVMEMLQLSGTDTEYGQMLLMKASTLLDGEGTDDLRVIARYNMLDIMIARGYPLEPESEEEAQYIAMKQQQMQQQAMMAQQNDPMMIAAMAEDKKANADLMDKQVDMFNAETDRMKVMVDAQKAGADIRLKEGKLQLDAMGQMNVLQSSQRNAM